MWQQLCCEIYFAALNNWTSKWWKENRILRWKYDAGLLPCTYFEAPAKAACIYEKGVSVCLPQTYWVLGEARNTRPYTILKFNLRCWYLTKYTKNCYIVQWLRKLCNTVCGSEIIIFTEYWSKRHTVFDFLSAEDRVRSQASLCEISGGHGSTRTSVSFSEYSGFPLSVTFHQCSVLIYGLIDSFITDAV